jgi:hypothetical protein
MAGGIYEQVEWPESQWDCVAVCDGCHTAIWSTRCDEETSDGFDAFLARNGWHDYVDQLDPRILNLCPECALRALRRGEVHTLADRRIRPVRSYTHADREVYAQLSSRERTAANLLLTEGRTA